ncbi:hypothetical protein [Paraburkholderia heleia]|uniref:hypothetical protein n=1 Tax=Paraburkholderia heleia TaxID=634127 RepID=UPI0031D2A389
MFRRIIFFGLLMLPGSFLILGVACIHPRMRMEIMQLGGFLNSINRTGFSCAVVRRRLR